MPPTTIVGRRRTCRAATSPDARCVPSSRAAQWIEALLARQQEPPILEKKTGLPYGWAIWLRARPPLPRPQHAREVVAVLLPRPLPAAGGRLPGLTMWQAVRRLGWQQWDPAPRDQRWMRWTSAVASLLLHVLFAVLLLWVALVRSSQPDNQGGEGERVQVEFIGQGAQEGGGDQPGSDAAAAETGAAAAAAPAEPAAAPSEARDSAPTASTASAQPAPVEAAAAPPSASEPAPAEPAPPATAPPLPTPPIQATEVAEATTDFVVPPVSVPRTEVTVVPRQAAPSVREREVQIVQAPAVVTPRPVTPVRTRTPQETTVQVREREVALAVEAPTPLRIPQAEVAVQVTPRDPTAVREREVATVTAPAVSVPTLPGREPVLRTRPSSEPTVRERAVAPASAAASAPARAPTTAAAQASSSSSSSTAPATAPAATATSSRAPGQAGAQARPTPGNWATPARGDDWGASNRDRPGSSAGAQANRDAGQGTGVFNADGSVRVPGQDGAGTADRGAPGGDNDGWTRDRIAQSGTWLKRPPYDYTPTSFDKYWVPNESLLAEWVRRGVQSVEIPLPGTSTKISCVISVLQFGGGCGLNDPNMQDQPAIARPPPDIPFKKELQEDNGSIR